MCFQRVVAFLLSASVFVSSCRQDVTQAEESSIGKVASGGGALGGGATRLLNAIPEPLRAEVNKILGNEAIQSRVTSAIKACPNWSCFRSELGFSDSASVRLDETTYSKIRNLVLSSAKQQPVRIDLAQLRKSFDEPSRDTPRALDSSENLSLTADAPSDVGSFGTEEQSEVAAVHVIVVVGIVVALLWLFFTCWENNIGSRGRSSSELSRAACAPVLFAGIMGTALTIVLEGARFMMP